MGAEELTAREGGGGSHAPLGAIAGSPKDTPGAAVPKRPAETAQPPGGEPGSQRWSQAEGIVDRYWQTLGIQLDEASSDAAAARSDPDGSAGETAPASP